MTINNNPMNPVPLWPSKDYWQCKQKTFHDAMAWSVLPNGTLPRMSLTLKGNPISVGKVIISVDWVTPSERSESYTGTITSSWSGKSEAHFLKSGSSYPRFIFNSQDGVLYNIEYYQSSQEHTPVTSMETGSKLISRQELNKRGYYTLGDSSFYLGPVDLNYQYNAGSHSFLIKRVSDDTTVASMSVSLVVRGCLPYNSNDRNGKMWIDTNYTGTAVPDGVYYIQFEFNGNTYYSEPFMWLSSVRNYTLVEYRSSQPIITTENYIDFALYGTNHALIMYLPNIPQRPPFQFDVEVTDIDGRKFAEKQVSYRKDRIAFNCYEAFAEAVRLLWHCDVRYIASRRIDYMEPPEVDWNNDNHLCDVVLEFESDTVMQTNGTASAYNDSSDSEHTAYDNSFDNSVN